VNVEITVIRDSPVAAADIANAVTTSFQQVVGEITESSGADPVSQVSVSVLREATAPSEPISPNTPLNLAAGLLAGLIVGLSFVILREVFDTRVRGEKDVAAITDAPIIGGIAFDASAVQKPLIVHDDPHSVRARSFVVTSSIPSEGKTTTAANLAIALADSGAQVVIIDADLRRPKLAEYMGMEGSVGLSDVLISRVALADALQPWGRGNLAVLPAGSIPPNPSELLGSRALAGLVRTLETEFDVVILDLPPLLPVTDAALVSKLTRGALLVVAAGRTQKNEFAGAIASLSNVGAPVAGIIMTMLPTKGPDASAYGAYGYGGYGYSSNLEDGAVSAPDMSARKRLSPDWGRESV
jgi:succinoglycan biosynthesis transport protein ExoP